MNIIKKGLALTAASAVLAAGLVGVTAVSASAHTPQISGNCTSISVKANSYDANVLNKYEIIINGVSETGTFGASLSRVIPVAGNGATTVWSAHIEAADGSYPGNGGGTLTCGIPTVNAPIIEVAPPTCEADGYIPVWLTNPRTQNPNGVELPGLGARAYFNREPVGPGIVTVTIQKIGPGFDAAFPNGTKVTGAIQQVLTILPRLGQSVDPDSACFEGPTKPEDIVVVTSVETPPDCVLNRVQITTTTTITGSAYNSETKTWTRVAPVSVDVVTYRDLTEREAFACAPVPNPIVTTTVSHKVDCLTELYVTTTKSFRADAVWNPVTRAYDSYSAPVETSSVDTSRPATVAELDEAECPVPEKPVDEVVVVTTTLEFKCGDTKATERTVTTTTPFKLVERVWVKDADNVVSETVDVERDLTAAEIKTVKGLCPVVVVDLPGDAELVITGTDAENALWASLMLLLSGIAAIVFYQRRNRTI